MVNDNIKINIISLAEGASNDSCSNLYCGPTPFSEIEVRDIAQFIYNNADNIDIYIDFHAYSQLWMTPYSSTRRLPEDFEDIVSIC